MSYSLTKLTEDLNNVQSLEDQPTITSNELKQTFDKAGNDIKDYINNILIPDVRKALEEVDESLRAELEKKLAELTKKMNTLQEKLDSDLAQIKEEISDLINNQVAKSTSYGDFVITNNQVGLSTNIQYGRSEAQQTFYNAGYKPIAIVGYSTSYDYNQQWEMREYSLSWIGDGAATARVVANPITNKGNVYYSTTVTLQILWIKIK